MPRNKIDANVRCPSCNGQLFPRVLVCDACGLKIEGEFIMNEFGSLTPDELHFLRVFIYCDGRIRDMEAALGVSYPTVKGHLASIKAKLNLAGQAGPASPAEGAGKSAAENTDLSEEHILDQLETGVLSYKDAVRLLRAARKEGGGDSEQLGG
jgi:hypothetical protein